MDNFVGVSRQGHLRLGSRQKQGRINPGDVEAFPHGHDTGGNGIVGTKNDGDRHDLRRLGADLRHRPADVDDGGRTDVEPASSRPDAPA